MKKVLMYVWNHFTNDARVLKEAKTLAENNCYVKIVAIHNPKTPDLLKNEKIQDNIEVERVDMYPKIITAYQRDKKTTLIGLAAGFILLGSIIWRISTKLFVAFSIILSIIVKVKSVRKNIIKLIRSWKMMLAGFQFQPHIVHSHDLNTLFQGIITSRVFRTPLVYDSHEVQTERTGYTPKIAKIWEASHVPFADTVIVENETRAAIFKEMYGVMPIPIYNYSSIIDIDTVEDIDLHDLLAIDDDKKILLYQGGIQAGRGIELIIEAQKHLKDTVLVLIGDGKLKESLQAKVVEWGLSDSVKFVGKVDLEDLAKYTKQAFVGFQVLQNVNLNHYSASSNKLFEYIMMHVPVIGCDFPEIKKVIDSENIGLSIDASDVRHIVEAVRYMIDHPVEYEQYKENCATAKLKYNWESEGAKLLNLYDSM